MIVIVYWLIVKDCHKPPISVNMLRHIFISEKYPNINNEKEADAKKMGHSVQQQGNYSKK